ncbi:MAG: MarR family transcriptional regulator [Candidatus Hodarchaeota archaeon]
MCPEEVNTKKEETSVQFFSEIAQIESDLSKLEQRAVDYFINSSVTLGRDPIVAAALSHLFLRKELTQKQLQELTGYSAGAISQALKECVKTGIVEKYRPKGRGAFRYTIKNMVQYITRSLLEVAEFYLSSESELKEIKRGLEDIPVELRKEQLYVGLWGFVNLVLKTLPLYQRAIQEIADLET